MHLLLPQYMYTFTYTHDHKHKRKHNMCTPETYNKPNAAIQIELQRVSFC